MLGLLPTSVTFRGTFRYATATELERAVAAIQDMIDAEEEDLAPDLGLSRKGCELRVRVDTTCARDHYLVYETLIETLAQAAIDGEVTGEIDDTITTYATSKPLVAKVAALIWIPLVGCESLLDLAVGIA